MTTSRLPLLLAFTLAPALRAATLLPADNATNIPPDTQLHLAFSPPATPPTLTHHGKITILNAATNAPVETLDTAANTATQAIGGVPDFNYYPITLAGNEVVIHPKNGALAYNTTYIIHIDADVFSPALTVPDWRFTTKPAAPKSQATITIAADDSADFATVQGAIDSLPANNTAPVTLFIKAGTYTELLCFADKNNLTFRGEDRKKTIIQYPNNDRFNNSNAGHIYHRGLLIAQHCDNLTFANLTLHNTTPQGGSQAEAIILNGSPTAHAILDHVDLYSFQDTLQINGQAYIADSYIEGDVDFMWGSGPCFFDHCECKGLRSKAYFTQIRNPPTNHGYIYNHCTFDTPAGIKDLYLARIDPARFPASEVVLIDCTLAPDAVDPVAWKLDAPKAVRRSPEELAKVAATIHFWEYNSHTPDGAPIDVSQRLAISKQLTQPQDADTVAHYSDPAYILGHDWNPRQPVPANK